MARKRSEPDDPKDNADQPDPQPEARPGRYTGGRPQHPDPHTDVKPDPHTDEKPRPHTDGDREKFREGVRGWDEGE
jgi:hypothetical protein